MRGPGGRESAPEVRKEWKNLKKVSEKRRTRWNQKGQIFTERWVQVAVGYGPLER